jgi:hypothetical protein
MAGLVPAIQIRGRIVKQALAAPRRIGRAAVLLDGGTGPAMTS